MQTVNKLLNVLLLSGIILDGKTDVINQGAGIALYSLSSYPDADVCKDDITYEYIIQSDPRYTNYMNMAEFENFKNVAPTKLLLITLIFPSQDNQSFNIYPYTFEYKRLENIYNIMKSYGIPLQYQ